MPPEPLAPPASRFRPGDIVVNRETLEKGDVVDPPSRSGGEFWYRVRFSTRVQNLPEDQLDAPNDDFRALQRLASAGRWGTIGAFRCAMTIERINRTNASTVYSYKAQRILFEPHQYKPLLKILASTDRKLLIADEVGLGKTIEAGLILTELEARQNVDKVIVLCPSRLRTKWREELNRKFDQDFQIYDSSQLREYLDRARDNPAKSRLRCIVSIEAMRSDSLRERIQELDPLDVAIVDEAHYGRNPETRSAKLIRDLAGAGDCVLLLTATPLQLRTRDLFTLLSSIKPDEFRDEHAFEQTIERFADLHRAAALVRSSNPAHLAAAADQLAAVFGPTPEPLAAQLIRDMRGAPPADRRAWVDLARRLDELHPLANAVTRTRKREVQAAAPTRRSIVQKCCWTPEEEAAYQAIVGAPGRGGWSSQPLTIGQLQRARQAASSIHAALLYNQRRLARATGDENELTDIPPEGPHEGAQVDDATPAAWPGPPPTDTKLNALLQHLVKIWAEEPDAKVLIFTYFVGTADYLAARLDAAGHKAAAISGKVRSTPRNPETDDRGNKIREFKDNLKVLVSTEVGSEGLDFQFCHHIVNYDLPWNPMTVEQRIGRIDRFGQKSEVIQVHSLVVEGTVEERILFRLYERIGIFKQSLGDLEAILGETVRELQRDYAAGRLTPEESERRVEDSANAIERRKLDNAQLEKEAGQLFGHEEFIREATRRVGHLGRYLTESGLLSVMATYLRSSHPACKINGEGGGMYSLNLSEDLARDIRLACSLEEVWNSPPPGSRLRFTFSGEIAWKNPEAQLVNASHPLLRAAVKATAHRMSAPEALVGHGSLTLSPTEEPEIPEGRFFLAVTAHIVRGARPRRDLDPAAWWVEGARILEPETGERLLHLTIERASQWASSSPICALTDQIWDELNAEFRRRNLDLRTRVNEENASWCERRKRLLDAEYERTRSQINARMETARQRERGSRAIGLFEAQLAKKEKRYNDRLQELERSRVPAVSLEDILAACLVSVRRA